MTNDDAAAYFAAKMDFEYDASDVHEALDHGTATFVLLDSRGDAAWNQGHVRGAVHMPRVDMARRIPAEYAADIEFVIYCWGPGCNGATKSAHVVASLGYAVKEMIGGFEYWAREGLPVDAAEGDVTRVPDPLTAPASPDGQVIHCDC